MQTKTEEKNVFPTRDRKIKESTREGQDRTQNKIPDQNNYSKLTTLQMIPYTANKNKTESATQAAKNQNRNKRNKKQVISSK